ncbi:PDZ domain-containing protein [Novosphingobium sp. PhB165]|uniref:aspartyl protease family protein n=1 Tax=Novosphingobium sp. PhB165 TaxID=2485105 RepID=UPI0010D14734|nr:aspartyl protease family protein [Novosphingobium sp. PhB165]TCM20547.1 PDZ domain-containing protein [Novosphingobium sp. PhB165]
MEFLLAAASAIACVSNPAALLDANRQATLLSTAAPETVVSRYRTRDAGLDGEATVTVDRASGMYIEESRSGPVGGTEGFDGTGAWARDLTGFALPQDGGNKRPLAVSEAYRNAGLWWRDDRAGATVESLGCDRLRITPKGGTPFEASFDPQTHLLRSVLEQTTFGHSAEVRYSAYAPSNGLMVPQRIETITDGDEASSATMDLLEAKPAAALGSAYYAMPVKQSSDWSLPGSGRVVVPFRMLNNHVIAEIKVNGRGPFPFLIDTGGHEIITPWLAQELGLTAVGQSKSSGAGEKTVTTGYTRIATLDAGGAVMHDPLAVVLDFSPLDVEGIRLGGMLGVGFFERFVVTLDYGAKTMTIIDRTRFAEQERRGAGAPVPFTFYEHMPQVLGSIDGRAARFNIDTGSRSDVTLTAPFVEKAALLSAYPGAVSVTDGWGVGGPSRSTVTRATMLTLGTVNVCGPVAGLSSARRGAFSDANYEGNVGSGLLKRYKVTFDYGNRTMYLASLRNPDPDTALADRAGMWINGAKEGVQVMDIMTGGPAASAGLRNGDVIERIANVRVVDRSLSDWRSYFKLVPSGRPVALLVSRGGDLRKVAIVPAELLPLATCDDRQLALSGPKS